MAKKKRVVRFTKKMAKNATTLIRKTLVAKAMSKELMKREHMHIVVGRSDGTILYEYSIGSPKKWENNYRKIARGKFADTVKTGKPGRHIQLLTPELATGKTIYWGSWIDGGLVASASGVQPYWDETTCKCIIAVARAYVSARYEKLAA